MLHYNIIFGDIFAKNYNELNLELPQRNPRSRGHNYSSITENCGCQKRRCSEDLAKCIYTWQWKKTMNQIRQWNGNANFRLSQSQLCSQWTVGDYFCPLNLMVLSPTNDFFPFGNPEWHLQNQAGKRSNSNNFANLGRTTKPDVIKIIIFIPFIFNSLFFSYNFSLLVTQDHDASKPETCIRDLRMSLRISPTANDQILQTSNEIYLYCELRLDFLALRDELL